MLPRLQSIPPVGNKIFYKLKPLVPDFFKPFNFCLYNSGTAALAAALILVKNNNKHIQNPEVLIPAYTCPDIISAAMYAGFTPILIDFIEDKPQLDCDQLLMNISEKTVAVIAINFLGLQENIGQLKKLLPDSITIIEDSAQGFPTSFNNHNWQGDIIISSFGRGKPLSLLGGGILLSKDIRYKDRLTPDKLKNPTAIEHIKYWVKIKLYNLLLNPTLYNLLTKLSFLRLGETQFKPLDNIEHSSSLRASLFEYNFKYYSAQPQIYDFYSSMIKKLDTDQIIDLPMVCNHDFQTPLLRYPILIKNKSLFELIHSELLKQGLGVSRMYKNTLPNIEGVLEDYFITKGENNNAKKLAFSLLTLPTHKHVGDKTLNRIRIIFEKYTT